MALNGIQIFKLTPKKNCKECGCPTCMAFSMKVAQGAMQIEQCPHMSDEALASLSEATAPPMKTIKIGTGDAEFTLGGETVLFRHEKTFVSKPRYAVSLCTCMDDAEVDAKLAAIPHVDYDRIGERMYAEIVYVNCDAEATADKYVALVQKEQKALEELSFLDVQILRSLKLLLKYARMANRFLTELTLTTMKQ